MSAEQCGFAEELSIFARDHFAIGLPSGWHVVKDLGDSETGAYKVELSSTEFVDVAWGSDASVVSTAHGHELDFDTIIAEFGTSSIVESRGSDSGGSYRRLHALIKIPDGDDVCWAAVANTIFLKSRLELTTFVVASCRDDAESMAQRIGASLECRSDQPIEQEPNLLLSTDLGAGWGYRGDVDSGLLVQVGDAAEILIASTDYSMFYTMDEEREKFMSLITELHWSPLTEVPGSYKNSTGLGFCPLRVLEATDADNNRVGIGTLLCGARCYFLMSLLDSDAVGDGDTVYDPVELLTHIGCSGDGISISKLPSLRDLGLPDYFDDGEVNPSDAN